MVLNGESNEYCESIAPEEVIEYYTELQSLQQSFLNWLLLELYWQIA